mmetsp:Transcript_80113/g.208938  ORF Transcript_80113/g.208938 Transcript_80113/m.208938 type:complete len:284 (+) Transcript_80113:232-1083(+)
MEVTGASGLCKRLRRRGNRCPGGGALLRVGPEAVACEGNHVAEHCQRHDDVPRGRGQRLEAQEDGETDGGHLVEVARVRRVEGGEVPHGDVQHQVVPEREDARQQDQIHGDALHLPDLPEDLPVRRGRVVRVGHGVSQVQRGHHDKQKGRQRHVENRIQGVHLHALALEADHDHQLHGGSGHRAEAEGEAEAVVVRPRGPLVVVLRHQRDRRAHNAGEQQQQLPGLDAEVLAVEPPGEEDLQDQCRQRGERADHHARGQVQKRQAEVVQGDVRGERTGEEEDR